MKEFIFEPSLSSKSYREMEENPNKEFLMKELIREFTIEHIDTNLTFEVKGNYKEIIDSFYGRDLGTRFKIYEKDENGEWVLLEFDRAIGYSKSIN